MKVITIKQGSVGDKVLNQLSENKKKADKRIKEKFDIPKEIMGKIDAKVEETNKHNKDNSTWSKSSFKLGMYAMYFILKNQ